MVSRRRLDAWGGAFFTLIGVAGCGGISETDGSGTGGTGSGATGGTGQSGAGAGGSAGTIVTTAGNGGTGLTDEIRGECTSAVQCSPGKACSAYTDDTGCQSGRACESALDECATNADCATELLCMPGSDWIRRCTRRNCFEGRPFLIDDEARLAETSERADWIAREVLGVAQPIDDGLRRALHHHWLLAARMEHASVAAFARFGLTLMALGAPSDLMLDCARAMQDETIHAELCFGLASRFGETVVGPGPLSVDRALDDLTLEAAVRNTLLEGCIGETLAAAEAQAACEHAKDPVVREVLERIAADETRHAALAFRFVAWALRVDPRCSELVRRALEQRLTISADTAPSEVSESALLGAGVLPARHRGDVRRYAYETIVLRALRALLDEPQPAAHPAVASC